MNFHHESSRVRFRNYPTFVKVSFWLVPEIFNSSASHSLTSCQTSHPTLPSNPRAERRNHIHITHSAHAIRLFQATLTTVVLRFFAAFRTVTRHYRNDLLLGTRNLTGPCNFVVPFKNLLAPLNYNRTLVRCLSHISRFNNGMNFRTISLITAVFNAYLSWSPLRVVF